MRLLAPAITIALFAFAGAAQAAAGGLDSTFGAGGRVVTDFNLSTDIANAVALQADGKLVVVGDTYTSNDFSDEDFAVARYNPDGTLDASFGSNGRVTTDFPGLAAVASSVLVQPDGKILVAGGAFPLFTFLGNMELVRYNPDGSLDAGFGNSGIVTTVFPHGSYAFALALQPDGRILAAGTDFVNFSSEANSDTDFAIARYNADGSPDASFGNGGQVSTDFERLNDDAFAVLVRPDGRIVVVGSSRDRLTDYDFAAARYLANGQLDPDFGTGGKVSTDFARGFDRARTAALQPDGSIVAAGFAIRTSGIHENFAAVRYLPDGALDTAFGGDGKVQVSFGSCCQFANRALLQDDGRIVAVGFQAYYPTPKGVQFALARYLAR